MKRILSVLILSAAIVGPASAQEVRVSLADREPAAVQADIYKAAETVCYNGQKAGEVRPQEMARCISDVSSDGIAQARAAGWTAAPSVASVGALASNGLAQGGASK